MRVGCRPLCVEQYHHAQSRRARRTECLEPRVGVSLSFQAILSGLYLKQAVVPHRVHLLPTDQRLVSEPVPFPTESGADTRLRSITSRAYTVCVYSDFDLTQSVSLSGACARGGDRFRSTSVDRGGLCPLLPCAFHMSAVPSPRDLSSQFGGLALTASTLAGVPSWQLNLTRGLSRPSHGYVPISLDAPASSAGDPTRLPSNWKRAPSDVSAGVTDLIFRQHGLGPCPMGTARCGEGCLP